MLKVFKNEVIKMINGKKFYILLATIIASIILMAALGSSNAEFRITSLNFVEVTLNGIIMKPLIPIFIILIIAETITEDYTNGTMKFSIMTPIKKRDLIIGKLLFVEMYTLALMIVSFLASYIIGLLAFGACDKTQLLNNLLYDVKCYSVILLPLLSFIVVISFIALFMNNSGAMIGLGIGIYFLMFILDQGIKNIMHYTFTGGMYAYEYIGKTSLNNILLFLFIACLYIIIFSWLNIITIKKKDILL